MPRSIAEASYHWEQRNPGLTEFIEVPDRGHALTIDHGWEQVARIALDFVKRYT